MRCANKACALKLSRVALISVWHFIKADRRWYFHNYRLICSFNEERVGARRQICFSIDCEVWHRIQIFWGPEFFKKNRDRLYALLNGILSAWFMNVCQRIERGIFYKLVNANKRALNATDSLCLFTNLVRRDYLWQISKMNFRLKRRHHIFRNNVWTIFRLVREEKTVFLVVCASSAIKTISAPQKHLSRIKKNNCFEL